MPVDLYVGGAEHAVLHLLYARFWHKVLFDLGHVSTPEPFQRLVSQGMILGEVEYTVHRGPGGEPVREGDAGAAAVRCGVRCTEGPGSGFCCTRAQESVGKPARRALTVMRWPFPAY